MVTRTRLIVTLYVHCLTCLNVIRCSQRISRVSSESLVSDASLYVITPWLWISKTPALWSWLRTAHSRTLVRTLNWDSKARRISAVDLVRRQERIAREEVAKQPRLRAIPRDELAGCCAPDQGEVTLPDMTIALWNRPANKRDTYGYLNCLFGYR